MKYKINSKKIELIFGDLAVGDYFYCPANFCLYRKYTTSLAYNIDSNLLLDYDVFDKVIKLNQIQGAIFERGGINEICD